MGNVDDGIVKPEIADDFRSCNVYSKDKCRNCFAKFYCSGGCMANSYNFHGRSMIPMRSAVRCKESE